MREPILPSRHRQSLYDNNLQLLVRHVGVIYSLPNNMAPTDLEPMSTDRDHRECEGGSVHIGKDLVQQFRDVQR